MKKHLVVVSISTLLLAGGEVLGTPVSYTGSTVGGDSWDRPFASGSCCSGLGPVLYEVQPYYTDASGLYNISSIQTTWDGYLLLYQTAFDPTDQTSNFVAGDDDGAGGIGTSDINGVTLTSGTQYFLVTTGFAAGDVGNYLNTITDVFGTANITLGVPVTSLEPGSVGYWDINGSSLGAGGVTPHGSWQGVNWTTSMEGTSPTVIWTDGSDANFSAGNDATGHYTIDLDAPVVVRNISVTNGDVTIFATNSSNTLTFADPRDYESIITTNENGSLVFNTSIQTADHLTKEGQGRVDFNDSVGVGGTFSVKNGSVYVNDSLVTANANNSGTLIINGRMESGSMYNSGTLMVNGRLTSDVGNRGLLGGSGTIKGNVDNWGIISPGNSIGVLNIDGSYIHHSGAALFTEISPNGNCDKLNITGQAILKGGLVRTSLPRALYTDGFAWNILHADGGVIGQFSSIEGQPNSETLDLILVSGEKGVDIQIERTPYASFGETKGQKATGVGLDQIVPLAQNRGDDMENLLTSLDFDASAQQIGLVLEALSPEMYTSFEATASQTTQHFSERLADRSASVREAEILFGDSGAARIGVAGIEIVSEKNEAKQQENQSAEITNPKEEQSISPKWTAWGLYDNSNAERSNTSEFLGYDSASNGVYVGLDGKLSPAFRVGMSFGAVSTDLEWQRSQDAGDQNAILFGAYSSLTIDRYYVDTSLSFGNYSNEANRTNPLGDNIIPITVDFDSINVLGRVGIGYNYIFRDWVFSPIASLSYLYQKTDDFQEFGGNYLGLKFQDDSEDTFISSLGARTVTQLEALGVTFFPQLQIAWKHNYSAGYSIDATFRDYPSASFSVPGAGASKDLLACNIGIVGLMTNTLSGNIQVGSNLGKDYYNLMVSAGLTIRF